MTDALDGRRKILVIHLQNLPSSAHASLRSRRVFIHCRHQRLAIHDTHVDASLPLAAG